MNTFLRWCRFNLVGIVGMAVQLTCLTVLTRWIPEHYLIASVAALEITLLHNFVWHVHYTWRDRPGSHAGMQRLLRFHLSNGMVSLAGNLLMMRLLVGEVLLPVLAANSIAILVCSVVNFYLGDQWAFGVAGE